MEFLAEIHTKVVHFPIALLITYSLLEIVGILFKSKLLNQCALIILICGIAATFFSVLTGNQAFEAYQYWNNESRNIFNLHQLYANITTWFFAFVAVLRFYLTVKKKFNGKIKYMFILSAVIGSFFIYKTAECGGELIDKFGVGTRYKNEQMQKNF